MASRWPSDYQTSFGPGPITRGVRALIIVNVAVFLVTLAAPSAIIQLFGLSPRAVLEHGYVWQLGTYLFVHSPSSFTHILFNMLALWMFGVDLERRWGTRGFTRYYFLTGIGAGISVLLVSLLPFSAARMGYADVTIGASGSIYGLLMAWALLFPDRRILFMFLFPLRTRTFVLLVGAIAFFSAMSASGGAVSNLAHLGGLLAGWLYLKGPKNLRLDLNYRLTRWRMERMRRRFNVHHGGRGNWEDRIH